MDNPAPPAAPATGLNYLALAKQHHADQVRLELRQAPFSRLIDQSEGGRDAG